MWCGVAECGLGFGVGERAYLVIVYIYPRREWVGRWRVGGRGLVGWVGAAVWCCGGWEWRARRAVSSPTVLFNVPTERT